MYRAFTNQGAVNFEREQVPNHLQPRPAGASLVFTFSRGIDKIQLRLLHQQPANNFVVKQRVPLHGEIEALGGKKWNRDISGGLADLHVLNRVGATPEMDSYLTNFASIKGASIEGSIDVLPNKPGQDRSACDSYNQEPCQHEEQNSPAAPLVACRTFVSYRLALTHM